MFVEPLGLREEAVERTGVVVDCLVERPELVAAQRRRGVEIDTAVERVSLESNKPFDDLERPLPLLRVDAEIEELLQYLMILGRELECLDVGNGGQRRVVQRAVIVGADLGEEPGLLADLVRGFDEAALGQHDRLPVPSLRLQIDHGLQCLAMARRELERFHERPQRLLAIAESLVNRTQATVDPDDGRLVQRTLLDQDRLVELAGVRPVLGLEQQVGALDQRRQVGRIELVGGSVVDERFGDIAELVGTARGPVEQLAVLLRIRIPLTDLAAQHLDHR